MKGVYWFTLVVMLGIGFGFQAMILIYTDLNFLITILIPLGFAKMWWDKKEELI